MDSSERQQDSCPVCHQPLNFGDHQRCRVEIHKSHLAELLRFVSQRSAEVSIEAARNVPDDILTSHEIQSAAMLRMTNELRSGQIEAALKIKRAFRLSDDTIESVETQTAAKEGMMYALRIGNLDTAITIQQEIRLPDDLLQQSEMQSAAKDGFVRLLRLGLIELAMDFFELSKLTEDLPQLPEVQAAARIGVELLLEQPKRDNLNLVLKLQDLLNLPTEIFHSITREKMVALLKRGDYLETFFIQEHLKLPDEVILSAAREVIVHWLKKPFDIIRAIQIRDRILDQFKIPRSALTSFPEVQTAAEAWLVSALKNNYEKGTYRILEFLDQPNEVINSKKVQTALKELWNQAWHQGTVNEVEKDIEERFGFRPPDWVRWAWESGVE